MRLDSWLVKQGHFESRNKAQNAITNNLVLINNIVVDKCHYEVSDQDKIKIIDHCMYVSRGAYKLLAAIEHWNIDFNNKVILDVGTSTGGFTDISIRSGCQYVYAVDVGTNQLHHSLKNDSRVISYENMHFKDLSISMFKHQIDIVVADLSFISLTKLIDKLIKMFNHPYHCIFLIKPQFELSSKEINKGKVNRQEPLEKAVNKIITYASKYKFKIIGVIPSPIKGNKLGNTEFLIYMNKQ